MNILDKLNIDLRFGNDKNNEFQLTDISFNSLSIIVGVNSSGKSAIMKVTWFISYVLQMYKLSFMIGGPNWENKFKEEVNKAFRYTFHTPEEIDGYIEALDENREIFSFLLSFRDGTLDHFNLDIINHEKFQMGEITAVRYGSRNTRTFQSYKQYVKLKEMLQISTLLDSSNLEKICEAYPLYDVLWFEGIDRLVEKYMKEGLPETAISQATQDLVFTSIGRSDDVDSFTGFMKTDDPKDAGEIYMTFSSGRQDKLSTMSDGAQSIIMLSFFGGYS